jgi:hypothetical protein
MDRPDSVAVNWKWIGDAWRLFTSNVFTWNIDATYSSTASFSSLSARPSSLAGGFGFLLSKEDWSEPRRAIGRRGHRRPNPVNSLSLRVESFC